MKLLIITSLLVSSLFSCQTSNRNSNTNKYSIPESSENSELIKSYKAIENFVNESNKKKLLDESEIDELYKAISNNPISTTSNLSKYDPGGGIGFCYGRATAAHLTASRYGVKSSSIFKLFIIGDMRSAPYDKTLWRFHVTTVVKTTKGLIAFDPIASKPRSMKSWINFVKNTWDNYIKDENGNIIHKANYYLVPADNIFPDISTVYREATQEPKDRIIQLNFVPTPNKGFTKDTNIDQNFYRVSSRSAKNFFFAVDDTSKQLQMNFTGLDLKVVDDIKDPSKDFNLNYDYLNYFTDLFNVFKESNLNTIKSWAAIRNFGNQNSFIAPSSSERATSSKSPNAHSFKFDF